MTAATPPGLERFKAALDALVPAGQPLGLAVSGGADSLAMLLLAQSARPTGVAVVTVDHKLREGSEADAEFVRELCQAADIPVTVIDLDWQGDPPTENIEAKARSQRYRAFSQWMQAKNVTFLATAHHADDQAETLLMRMARGAGLGGLSGVRRSRRLPGGKVVRPVLDFTREELREVVDATGITPRVDPMNADTRFDRVRLREALAAVGFGDTKAFAASAHHLAEAEHALRWATNVVGKDLLLADEIMVKIARPGQLPDEIRRRLMLRVFDHFGEEEPRGPQLAAALKALAAGGKVTLGALLLAAKGEDWLISRAPARKTG